MYIDDMNKLPIYTWFNGMDSDSRLWLNLNVLSPKTTLDLGDGHYHKVTSSIL